MAGDDEDPIAVLVVLRGHTEVGSWRLDRVGRPDIALVDALARAVLAARRLGCTVRLRNPSDALCDLLELCGLADVVPSAADDLRVEAGREAEGGEQLGRVEEVVVTDDPVT